MIFLKRLVFKLALGLPKSRNWYDALCSEGRLLGAPPDEEKLLSAMLRQIYEYFVLLPARSLAPLYRKRAWMKVRTFGVRMRLKSVEAVTVKKKFIITLLQLPESVQAANRCIEYARRHEMHHGMELWPAVDKFQALEFFKSHGFTWRHTDYNFELGKDPLPEMGCFASHYLLWERCVELGEAIVVLEHDAIPVAPIPSLRFRHVILLSRPAWRPESHLLDTIRNTPPGEVFYPLELLDAAHGYAITPEGAGRLIDATRTELIVPADSFINKRHVDILYHHPYLVDFDYRFSTIDKRDSGCVSPEETWEHYTGSRDRLRDR